METVKTSNEEFYTILRDAFEKGESEVCVPINEFVEDLSAKLLMIIKGS
ncbi:hypothetical protein ACFVHQ_01245 [Actinomycetes bacterium NPDC127524]|nr:hypothetical protein [Bacillus sp. OV322]SFC52201.1 hypothetical protein SAMN05443252_10486 [Bacillus sp. OV322]